MAIGIYKSNILTGTLIMNFSTQTLKIKPLCIFLFLCFSSVSLYAITPPKVNDTEKSSHTINATKQTPQSSNKTIALIETSMGDIKLALEDEKAPVTVKNFINYAESGFYDNTIFHRVINNFMIQGGGFTVDMEKKPTQAAIINESSNGLKNVVGSIAMARLPSPHSATSQFFINVNNNRNLNYKGGKSERFGYAVFGHVIEGMDVVNSIKQAKTSTKMRYQNVPMETILIKKVTIISEAEESSS